MAFVEWSRTASEPHQEGNRRQGCAPHGAYPCVGDDHWVAISVKTDAQWRGLRRAMRDPAGLSDEEIAALEDEGVIGSTPIGVPALSR